MTRTTGSQPRIAIIGGGIGGLAAAAFLDQVGIESTVYEQATALKEVGAGLIVAPNAARQLRRLGALDDLVANAVRLDIGWEFRRWENGHVLSAENLTPKCKQLYGEHTYAAHRADLLSVIKARVPETSLRLGCKCTGITALDDRWRLTFADGDVVEADVVVGADGVHSVIRHALFNVTPEKHSGLCAFRGLVPADQAPEFALRPAQTLWLGPKHHFVHYPVSDGRFVNVVAFAPAGGYATESWSATATTEEFLAEFEGWDARVSDLINVAGTPGRWALLERPPLTRWINGTAALLGDSAHPVFPFFAQGAAQSIEDAAVLAKCLSTQPEAPAAALQRYEQMRLSRATDIQNASHGRAHSNHLPDGEEQQARDRAFASRDPLVANGWIYGYDPEAVWAGQVGSG